MSILGPDRDLPKTRKKAGEKTLEKKLKAWVESKGGKCVKMTGFERGFPDRLLLFPGGRQVFAEVKSEGKNLGPKQAEWRDVLEGMGHRFFKVDSNEALERLKQEYEKGI